jgi:pimeloyl-ACP methyl ester carboxylesterase
VRFLLEPRFGLMLDRPGISEAPPGNLVLFDYDWRLSNRWTAERLKSRVEHALARWRESARERRDATVVFVCHSMGGLVVRWYLEKLDGAEVARALVTLGTPHRGALNALEQLVNGVRKGSGPLKFDLTEFARSLPSSYQLLPEYACIEASWGSLLKTTELTLPGLDEGAVADGMRFHDELNSAATASYPLMPVVGIGQPTWTTATLVDERVAPLPTIAGRDLAGDGTVPRLSARPKGMAEWDPAIHGVGEGHGSLAVHRSVFDQLDFVLTAEDVTYRAPEVPMGEAVEERPMGVSVPDLHDAGEAVEVTVHAGEARLLEVLAVHDDSGEPRSELVRFAGELDQAGRIIGTASLEGLDPGGYTLVVRAPDDTAGADVQPVRATTLVWAD